MRQKKLIFHTKSVLQYLERYAEPSAIKTATCFLKRSTHCRQSTLEHTKQKNGYDKVLVIPAYNESTAFIRRLKQTYFIACERLLVIVVINQPTGKPITRLNQRLLAFIQTAATNQCDFIALNYCQPGIPDKQGVGLARKIGCDLALYLIAHQCVLTPWIFCSDADAYLPANYFDLDTILESDIPSSARQKNVVLRKQSDLNKQNSLNEKNNLKRKNTLNSYSAISFTPIHNFEKEKNQVRLSCSQQKLLSANESYENYVLDYRDGLKRAGSPYGFLTFGSCLCIQAECYAQVRGFPKRSGGEDFYLLNKLAKIKPILSSERRILIKPRVSTRVPFGTGPAIAKRLTQPVANYDPQAFEELKQLLVNFESIAQLFDIKDQGHCHPLQATELKAQLGKHLSLESQDAMNELNIFQLIEHWLKQAKNSQQAKKMAHDWFDALRTLKFIHRLAHQKNQDN